MPTRKFAISIPEDVMSQVDRAAARRGWTRSRFIAEVLRRTAHARSDSAITRAVNRLFEDPDLAEEQAASARAYRSAAPRKGWEW
jgi:metal-responsive CopG/Arc/MetJ family transcriptional regulator